MDVLPWNFSILRLCGIWRPRGWSDGWKKYLYNFYTIFTIVLTYTFTISELVEFLLSSDDLDEAANNSLMLISMLGMCYKIANFLWKRDEILTISDMLTNDVCRPRGHEEIVIKSRFDRRGRRNTLLFGGLAGMAIVTITIGGFFANVPERSLPFNAWLPFDYTNFLGFWIAFTHQIVAHAVAATISSIHDTLFYGFMAQACSQLNILKSRLRSMPRAIGENITKCSPEIAERLEIGKCVRHHYEILRFVKMSNDIFGLVIFMQFSVSTFAICLCTYMLSKTSVNSPEFTFMIAYLGCMLVQIFLMCWNGNEVITESMDVGTAVYEMDWECLGESTKRNLRMIMIRSLDPIKYTSGHVITLSLDSYNSLMKLSYSVYNLMQQTSEKPK